MAARRIGVIVVHGIGEQRRFEFLDGQVRPIVAALKARGAKVTVEITPGNTAAFHAEQDSWAAGASVTIAVNDPKVGYPQRLHFHEVWWADVNEPYSLFKQMRFWLWGLSVWLLRDKPNTALPSADSVRNPVVPRRWLWGMWYRARLFLVGVFSVVAAGSVGMLTFLITRLFGLRTPSFLKLFANYVSGVKLFNQKQRHGAGLIKRQDFLDSILEPPRVSVRRRMIRAIAEIAMEPYDRWYVLAHSLGTVVALNGLMETAFAWPGYFDEATWRRLCAGGLAGPAREGWQPPVPTKQDVTEPLPARPAWAGPNEVAYRSRIFERCHGLLTFGSPLEKFATLWPARVPISREPAFQPGMRWLNVFDPTDPVSGQLNAFDSRSPARCPQVRNVGYRALWVLLASHLCYFSTDRKSKGLADGVVEWLLRDDPSLIAPDAGRRWFDPQTRHGRLLGGFRSGVAWVQWALLFALLVFLGTIVTPTMLKLAAETVRVVRHGIPELPAWVMTLTQSIAWLMTEIIAGIAWATEPYARLINHLGWWRPAADLVLAGVLLTLIVGGTRRLLSRKEADWAEAGEKPELKFATPEPNPRVNEREPEDLATTLAPTPVRPWI